ncbi:MAG: neutral/alkaline non-lysosomal ceramidase N-terminal domain-containing protein [Planctomycetes bacterium]|nr:neutral/alkaline non-lysosomal ceramidase N-terminal domain-containing protein [Planctomycetota bacterium]
MVGTFNERLAEKAWDQLYARALVLDDGTAAIGIVVVDSCYVPRKVLDDAKKRIAGKVRLEPARMLMSATHTHTAPASRDRREVKADPEYVELVTRGIVEAVVKAHEQLEPAELGWGVTQVPEELFNRRWFMKAGGIVPNPFGETTDRVRMNPPRGSELLDRPAGPTDPDVSVIAVRTAGGRPIALLANYSLHYVGGIPPGGVSADYFGEFARLVEDKLAGAASVSARSDTAPDENAPPVVGMLSNGTSGDVNNINFRDPQPAKKPFEQMRAVAKRVADAALGVCERMQYRRDLSLDMRETKLTLQKRRPTPRQLAFAKEVLAATPPSPPLPRGGQGGSLPRLARPYAKWAVELSEPPHEEELILQAVRVGEVGICAIPCEVFTEIGLELKEKSPLKPTFTIELANGHYGYLPTPRQHEVGGYETWLGSCILEEHASEKIAQALLEMLEDLHAKLPSAARRR